MMLGLVWTERTPESLEESMVGRKSIWETVVFGNLKQRIGK